jgi:hypothetical protein
MKHALQLAATAAALVGVVATAAIASASRSAQAGSPAIARPVFTPEPPRPRLDLTAIVDDAGRRELARLASDPAVCREALSAVGARYLDLPPHSEPDSACGFEDAIALRAAYADYAQPVEVTCPLAARLYLWEFDVLAPAAEKHLGATLVGVEALGAYSCRTRAGDGKLSHHARAEAADIGGFRLSDGRFISVKAHYRSDGPEAAFLREAHAGACKIFDVTLGPDYDAAHADHFHVDVGGESACR